MAERRPRVLVMNQYYSPGVEATAHLLSELCAALADEFEITVVTGRIDDPPAPPGRIIEDGVEVIRVRSTAYERRRIDRRAINYLTYLVQSLRAGLGESRPDIVLCMTDPPMIGDAALVVARRFRAPLVVISQDVFPEIAVALQRLENRAVIEALRLAVGYYLQRADRVVAIGETMRERLIAKGADAERVHVIPNWVDTAAIEPRPFDNEWSRENGLHGRFVVMHSGNIGHAQNLDALIRAATFLRDVADLSIVLIGAGARRDDLAALADRLETDNVSFLPYQPRAALADSLSTGSIHVVGLARGLAGYVVPSRLYGIMSAGRPVLVAAELESETARIVTREQCGIVVPPGRPELLADAIRGLHDGEHDLEDMGRRGRAYVEREADRSVAISRYRALLREVIAEANE